MITIGPYEVLQELGRGAMGSVHKARGPDGRLVAIKCLLGHRSGDPRSRRRFANEITALARLRHPHVVAILDAGEHEGVPWFALEYVPGTSLERKLRSGPLPIPEAIRVASQLSHALAYVHACGLVHRDLKPDNVLVADSVAKLTDFGLVFDRDDLGRSRLTASNAAMGTPGYWPPEQATGRSKQATPLSDVYGLGAILYACLTGRPPYVAETLTLYYAALSRPPLPPRELRPEVPAWLNDLCLACLRSDPELRPPSADAVARSLTVGGAADPAPRSRGWVVAWGVAAAAAALLLASLLWFRSRGRPEPQPAEPAEVVASPEALAELAVEDPARAQKVNKVLSLVLVTKGKEYAQGGDHARALRTFDAALVHYPDDAEAYFWRGVSRLALHFPFLATEDLEAALELGLPANLEALAQRSVAQRQRELVAAEGFAATAAAREARALLDADRFAEAVAAYDELIEHLQEPTASPFFLRGRAKRELGRHAEAVADFDRALSLGGLPDDDAALATSLRERSAAAGEE